MRYYFQDQSRLTLSLGSPNHCAIVLGVAMMALLCGLVYSEKLGASKVPKILFYLGLEVNCILLAMTFSRGGWLACLGGVLTIAVLLPMARRKMAVALIFLIATIYFFPAGMKRLRSIGDSQDRSISNRLVVWQGAAIIAKDNFLTGVGEGSFGSVFGSYYQPLEMPTSYLAALNNGLTIAAERGLVVFFIGLWVFCFVLFTVVVSTLRSHNLLGVFAVTGSIVMLIASFFSFSIGNVFCDGISLLLFSLLSLMTFNDIRRDRITWKSLRLTIGGAFCTAIVAVASICLVADRASANIAEMTRVKSGPGGLALDKLTPRGRRGRELIILIPDKNGTSSWESRKLMRWVAYECLPIYICEPLTGGNTEVDKVVELIKEIRRTARDDVRIIVCGMGSGGRLALLAAANRRTSNDVFLVVAFSPELFCPIKNGSPLEHSNAITPRLTLVYGDKDSSVNWTDVSNFVNTRTKEGNPTTIDFMRGGHEVVAKWSEGVSHIGCFLKRDIQFGR